MLRAAEAMAQVLAEIEEGTPGRPGQGARPLTLTAGRLMRVASVRREWELCYERYKAAEGS